MAVGYDAASRITSIKDAADAACGSIFAYDLRDRLTSVQAAGSSQTYAYDAVFHYDAGGKLIAESTTAGNKTTTQEYV